MMKHIGLDVYFSDHILNTDRREKQNCRTNDMKKVYKILDASWHSSVEGYGSPRAA